VLQDLRHVAVHPIFEHVVKKEWENGALAVISTLPIKTRYPGFGQYVRYGIDVSMVTIPAFELTLTEANYLLNLSDYNYTIIVNITNNDFNYWQEVLGSNAAMVPFSLILGLVTFCCTVVAFTKLVITIHNTDCSLSLGKFVLVLEVIGNLIRLIYVTVDPIFSRTTMNFVTGQIFITLSTPFTLSSTLLISLYWREVTLRSNVTAINFLKKFRWLFWGIFLPMLVMQITTSTLNAIGFPISVMVVIIGAVYVIISVSVTILFIFGGLKVLESLNRFASPNKKARKLVTTTKRLMFSSIFQVSFALLVIIGAVGGAFWTNPWSFYTLWFLIFLTLSGVSLTQILAFRITSRHRGSHANGVIHSSELSTSNTTPPTNRTESKYHNYSNCYYEQTKNSKQATYRAFFII